MERMFKLCEIDFRTYLKEDEIWQIVDDYIKGKKEKYEVNRDSLLYDPKSHVTNEPVWYVDVIPMKVKEHWPEAYDSLAISDSEGRLVYVQNDHGVVVEKF